MPHLSSWLSLATCALLAGVCYLAIRLILSSRAFKERTRGLPLPPGPKPYPLIGNLLHLPKGIAWHGYAEMCRKYGGMVYLDLGHRPLLVLDDLKVINELLDKRSAIYSSRITTGMFELVGWDWNLGMMPYGPRWRENRRVLWSHFHPSVVLKYEPAQRASVRRCLLRLLHSPERLVEHVRYSLGATMIEATYGLQAADTHDKYIAASDEGMKVLDLLVSGSSVFEFFPRLARVPTWLPFTQSVRRIHEARRNLAIMRDLPWEDARKQMAAGESSENCTMHDLVESFASLKGHAAAEGEENAKSIAAVVYSAGIDTTFTVISGFFAAIARHPEVQARARAELDAVVGPHRLPTLADRAALPYVDAVLKETMRWHVSAPLGVPHVCTADDEYGGMFIPAGTAIMVNIWSIMHNPEQFPQPEVFDPDRYFKHGKLDLGAGDPSVVFGFGRRICPGRHFAESVAWLYVASILHTLDVSLPLDANGAPVDEPLKISPGWRGDVIENLRCTIRPRSAAAEDLIRNGERRDED
ncbi:cytochrome P450 [Epithele typhae]|uniref:cytochrome P450 n=1 Tax=Epithele typhae TaxID=378194 RepID=UPI0020072400|nr:cytochrome P450 [Epithele typhae]KAH9924275.1 cytochrome P450 [Epithele typhae]